ncbi:MAG: FIST C-terminal domain-containing protein [Betaproteobacteria bacterium]|nr:FIST C-terminal domain-containing protein [Betaproteobacteria bacterium]
MDTRQVVLFHPAEAATGIRALVDLDPALVLAFGALPYFETPDVFEEMRRQFPGAVIAGCSTAGEIGGCQVHDGACVVTAIAFDHASARAGATRLRSMADSFDAGVRLGGTLPREELRAVLVFGTGVRINGSALVRGLQSALPREARLSGGLAADAGAFKRTWTMGPAGCADDQIVAVGLYGNGLRLAYGSFAGWVAFGPARKVTRCADNVLYELDGERALDVYKRYLGEHAARLPASGLLFPFEMLTAHQEKRGIFRTILGVDEADGSLTLAGDIDPTGYLKLMHSNTERLIDGAETAARTVLEAAGGAPEKGLALLVSCVGRKLVMGARVDEEVEAVAALLGNGTTVAGFYSNGEIASAGFTGECRLHNQTMTITWLGEA